MKPSNRHCERSEAIPRGLLLRLRQEIASSPSAPRNDNTLSPRRCERSEAIPRGLLLRLRREIASSPSAPRNDNTISPRHCERSEAIPRRLLLPRGGDCFVASLLAMTAER